MKPMHGRCFQSVQKRCAHATFFCLHNFFLSLSGVLSAQKLHTADTRMTGAKSQEEGQEKGVNDRLSIPVLLNFHVWLFPTRR